MRDRRISFTWLVSFVTALACASATFGADAPKYPSFGKIERKDSRLDKILPPGAHMEQLADGFDWSEGPVWVKDGGYLLFSDPNANTIDR